MHSQISVQAGVDQQNDAFAVDQAARHRRPSNRTRNSWRVGAARYRADPTTTTSHSPSVGKADAKEQKHAPRATNSATRMVERVFAARLSGWPPATTQLWIGVPEKTSERVPSLFLGATTPFFTSGWERDFPWIAVAGEFVMILASSPRNIVRRSTIARRECRPERSVRGSRNLAKLSVGCRSQAHRRPVRPSARDNHSTLRRRGFVASRQKHTAPPSFWVAASPLRHTCGVNGPGAQGPCALCSDLIVIIGSKSHDLHF